MRFARYVKESPSHVRFLLMVALTISTLGGAEISEPNHGGLGRQKKGTPKPSCFEQLTHQEKKELHALGQKLTALRSGYSDSSDSPEKKKELQEKVREVLQPAKSFSAVQKAVLETFEDDRLDKASMQFGELNEICEQAEKRMSPLSETERQKKLEDAFFNEKKNYRMNSFLSFLAEPLHPEASLNGLPRFSRLAIFIVSNRIPSAMADDLEKAALERYRVTGYGPINSYLREKAQNPSPETLSDITLLDALQRKSSIIPGNVQLFRGMNFDIPKEWKDKNFVYPDLAFGSSSLDPAVAQYFAGLNDSRPSVIDIIQLPKEGIRAAFAPRFKDSAESEVLLPRGVKYRVIDTKTVSASSLSHSNGTTTKPVLLRIVEVIPP